MDNLVFLDTETTGPDFLMDRLFQVCYKYRGKITSEYFKPPIPISIKAQSVTHITNKMIADKQDFSYSEMRPVLSKLLSENILVAHNAVFDIDMLAKEGVMTPRFICTLKVVRFLDTECVIPEYNLQYLRYYYGLEIDAPAHDATGDVITLEAVFKKLYEQMLEKYGDDQAVIEKMIEVSGQPTLFRMFNFGKHKGKMVEEVLSYDRPYMEWLLEKKLDNSTAYIDEDWIFTLKYHLRIQD